MRWVLYGDGVGVGVGAGVGFAQFFSRDGYVDGWMVFQLA